ncbi:hypothetical protein EU805_13905 [Salipiger sp. IMCC34102]|uniref:hypothetical protein n=1 Tax=Salipiger sp. IMCC34102 TaxID=2510647 RepID=UPI00101CC83A|nr:hypothetical protein [Salipiger sp. IMCC34102]RYH01350.1 hypothetical protein EU805_13905 [Salipiger sp. IMCC34102]
MSETYLTDRSHDRRSTLSAVIVGAIVALGLMVMFTLLGLSIGIASLEAVGEGLGIGAALYIVVTQLISLAVGGFAAARFAASHDTISAALAGAAVWSLTTVIVAFGGLNTGTAAISSATSLVSQTAQTTANAAQAITPDNISLPDFSQIAGNLSLADLPPQVQTALENADVTPAQLRTEAREAFRNVVSQQEMARARTILTNTLGDVAASPGSLGEEVNAALDQLIGGENAVFSEEDITEATNTLPGAAGYLRQSGPADRRHDPREL